MGPLTIKQWRVLNELTQDDMAQKLEIHRNSYRIKENGKHKWNAKEISKLLLITGKRYEDLIF